MVNNEQQFIGSFKSFRWKMNRIAINPPAQVLHTSNISAEACSEEIINDLLSPFGNVQKVKLVQKNNKFMVFVKMGSVEEAFTVIAYLHSTIFFHRRLIVSFT